MYLRMNKLKQVMQTTLAQQKKALGYKRTCPESFSIAELVCTYASRILDLANEKLFV